VNQTLARVVARLETEGVEVRSPGAGHVGGCSWRAGVAAGPDYLAGYAAARA
jgi:hypothetical protein